MAATQSLAEWNEQFGDKDFEQPEPRKQRHTVFTGVCYPMTIKGATLCRSSRGDVQIMLDMDLRDHETGEVVTALKEWVDLPFQPVTDLGKSKEIVHKLTAVRRNQLSQLLSAVDPHTYALGHPELNEGDDSRNIYKWGSDTEKLIGDDYTERQIECNRAVLKFAEECHALLEENPSMPIEGWSGTELYYSRKENTRKPQYPFTNFHVYPAFGLPLYAKSCEVPA